MKEPEFIYKLTDRDRRTYGGFQWRLKRWFHASGEGELCGPGWLHAYSHPLVALLHNPVHAGISFPRLFWAKWKGQMKDDQGMKLGVSSMLLIEEVKVPTISPEQKVRYAIGCAWRAERGKRWGGWAQRWLSGEDRSANAAHYAVSDVSADDSAYYAASAAYFAYYVAHSNDSAYYVASAAHSVAAVPLNFPLLAEWAMTDSIEVPDAREKP